MRGGWEALTFVDACWFFSSSFSPYHHLSKFSSSLIQIKKLALLARWNCGLNTELQQRKTSPTAEPSNSSWERSIFSIQSVVNSLQCVLPPRSPALPVRISFVVLATLPRFHKVNFYVFIGASSLHSLKESLSPTLKGGMLINGTSRQSGWCRTSDSCSLWPSQRERLSFFHPMSHWCMYPDELLYHTWYLYCHWSL